MAGDANPDHRYSRSTHTGLLPKFGYIAVCPGFKFVYWLGDVSNPEAVSTVVHLDKPKIVIAVFEQANGGISGGGLSGGGGGLTYTGGGISAGGSINTTSAEVKTQTVAYSPSGDTTPEVPEPATGVLLVLGSVFAFAKRRRY